MERLVVLRPEHADLSREFSSSFVLRDLPVVKHKHLVSVRTQGRAGKERATLNQARLVESVGNGAGQSDKVILLGGWLGCQGHHQLRHRHAALRSKDRVDGYRHEPVCFVTNNEINIGQQNIIAMRRPVADSAPNPARKSCISQEEIRRRRTKIDANAIKIRNQDLG